MPVTGNNRLWPRGIDCAAYQLRRHPNLRLRVFGNGSVPMNGSNSLSTTCEYTFERRSAGIGLAFRLQRMTSCEGIYDSLGFIRSPATTIALTMRSKSDGPPTHMTLPGGMRLRAASTAEANQSNVITRVAHQLRQRKVLMETSKRETNSIMVPGCIPMVTDRWDSGPRLDLSNQRSQRPERC